MLTPGTARAAAETVLPQPALARAAGGDRHLDSPILPVNHPRPAQLRASGGVASTIGAATGTRTVDKPGQPFALFLRWRQLESCARLLVVLTLLHLLAMAATWPDAITNTDELSYVAAAMDYAEGRRLGQAISPDTLKLADRVNTLYPAGTSLAQAPWVAAFGWRGAFAVPLLGFLGAVWAMYALLRAVGANPWFALVLPAFPATTVLARCANSDTWNLFLVTAALALLASGARGPPWRWTLAGLTAGLVLSTREASVLVLGPAMLAVLLGRQPGWPWLLLGGVIGSSVRPISAWVLYDNPLFRHPGYGEFTLPWALRNLPFYAAMTLVLIPGGLVALAGYRGWRWRELVGGATAFVVLHAAYQYGAGESGGPNAVVIGGRYLMPALPVFALALAWQARPALAQDAAAGRWLDRLRAALDRRAPALFATIGIASVAIHPLSYWWSRNHARLAHDICTHVPADARVVISGATVIKALGPWHCRRAWIPENHLTASLARQWARESTPLYVVNGQRDDSAAYRAGGAAFLQWLDARVPANWRQVVHRARLGVVDLEISRVVAPPDVPPPQGAAP